MVRAEDSRESLVLSSTGVDRGAIGYSADAVKGQYGTDYTPDPTHEPSALALSRRETACTEQGI